MQRSELVSTILTDAAQGEFHTLRGLVDFLLWDLGTDLERLIDIAERSFGIPEHVSINTLNLIHGESTCH